MRILAEMDLNRNTIPPKNHQRKIYNQHLHTSDTFKFLGKDDPQVRSSFLEYQISKLRLRSGSTDELLAVASDIIKKISIPADAIDNPANKSVQNMVHSKACDDQRKYASKLCLHFDDGQQKSAGPALAAVHELLHIHGKCRANDANVDHVPSVNQAFWENQKIVIRAAADDDWISIIQNLDFMNYFQTQQGDSKPRFNCPIDDVQLEIAYKRMEKTVVRFNSDRLHVKNREFVLMWLSEVCQLLQWSSNTWHAGVNMWDQFIFQSEPAYGARDVFLVAVASIYYAALVHEVCDEGVVPNIKIFTAALPPGMRFHYREVIEMQMLLVRRLFSWGKTVMMYPPSEIISMYLARLEMHPDWAGNLHREVRIGACQTVFESCLAVCDTAILTGETLRIPMHTVCAMAFYYIAPIRFLETDKRSQLCSQIMKVDECEMKGLWGVFWRAWRYCRPYLDFWEHQLPKLDVHRTKGSNLNLMHSHRLDMISRRRLSGFQEPTLTDMEESLERDKEIFHNLRQHAKRLPFHLIKNFVSSSTLSEYVLSAQAVEKIFLVAEDNNCFGGMIWMEASRVVGHFHKMLVKVNRKILERRKLRRDGTPAF